MAFDERVIPVYQPSFETQQYLQKRYAAFEQMRMLKDQPIPILNNVVLQDMWDVSQKEYNTIVSVPSVNDWMRQYGSSITQDKVNMYLSQLVTRYIKPEIFARNNGQQIDRTVSKFSRAAFEYTEDMDGFPSEDGHVKQIRAAHECLVKGTVHQEFGWLDGMPTREIVPNEEIYVPNFYINDIQSQGMIIRAQRGITYEEGEAVYGELENWKYVSPGTISNWNVSQMPFLRNFDTGILRERELFILKVWSPVPKKKLKKNQKRQKYYNVIINGILMFPEDNLSPYRHGMYPLTKNICDMFDSNYYWGKPLTMRWKEDKKAYDAFKTIVLNKAKLNLLPPMVSMNGLHINQEVVVPGKISPITGNINDLQKIPGIGEAVNTGDYAVMNLLKGSMDEAATEPVTPGSTPSRQAARTTILQETNAQRMLSILGKMLMSMVTGGTYLTVANIFQFFPMKKMDKLVLSDQQLENGKRGELHITFESIKPMTEEELLNRSIELFEQEKKFARKGQDVEVIKIDPEYLETMDIFIQVKSNPVENKSDAFSEAQELRRIQILRSFPDVDQRELARSYIRTIHADEDALLKAPQMAPAQGQALPPQGTPPEKGGQGSTEPIPADRKLQRVTAPMMAQ